MHPRCLTFIFVEITQEITVYRYSAPRLLEYLRAKVARLATAEVFESSRTLIRNLARDGLMEDGKEALLEGERCNNYFSTHL